jgi:hypothetical protein
MVHMDEHGPLGGREDTGDRPLRSPGERPGSGRQESPSGATSSNMGSLTLRAGTTVEIACL